jgi:hypothetical protein
MRQFVLRSRRKALLFMLLVAPASVACQQSSSRTAPRSEDQILAAATPRLASAALSLRRAISGPRKCVSPLPDLFPDCQRDSTAFLLIRKPSQPYRVGEAVLGLALVPDATDRTHIGSWYINRLGRSLGEGWYEVHGYTGLD